MRGCHVTILEASIQSTSYCYTVTGATTGPPSTTTGPSVNHRRTTDQPPPDHRLKAVDRQSTVGSNGGHRCHVAADVAVDVAWRGYYPPAKFRTHDQRV
ncbi:hypothetical protein Tco_0493888 [Tanacetum coccineum]